MNDESFKKFAIIAVLLFLIVLSFFIVKQIFLSIITGVILGYIFNPLYNLIIRVAKSKNLSAFLVCVLVLLILIIPIWFFAPIAIKHTFEVYRVSQQIDYLSPLKEVFPGLFASEEISNQVSNSISSLVSKTINSILKSLGNILLNLPIILLHLMIVFFTFFYILRDKNLLFNFLESISPFSKETERKFIEYSRGIASSVIYGQVVIGVIQGLIVGIGLFIFKVPNFLFLTLLAILFGILPIIGTPLVWIPAVFYLFLSGNTSAGIGLLIFGLVSSSIDNVLRPFLVSRRTKIPSSLILVGMIGGFLFIGVMGLILGPLILSYLLIILEIFRKKDLKSGILEIK
ncbi:MAG: AI-2E family transporter [Nanoarchaeota archaeon]